MKDLDLPQRWIDTDFAAELVAQTQGLPVQRPRRPRRTAAMRAGAVVGTVAGCAVGAALTALLLVLPAHVRAAPADAGFDRFVADWRRAVARGDAQSVAATTRLPFLFEGRALDADGFRREVWPALFTPALRRCWVQARPVAEAGAAGERALHCGSYSLHFEARGGTWVLREFGADGEI